MDIDIFTTKYGTLGWKSVINVTSEIVKDSTRYDDSMKNTMVEFLDDIKDYISSEIVKKGK